MHIKYVELQVYDHVHVCGYHICCKCSANYTVFLLICVDGNDFVIVPRNITFHARSINNTFSITIQDDVLLEMNETFNVTLLTIPSSKPISIANGTTTVVIVDNDRKC